MRRLLAAPLLTIAALGCEQVLVSGTTSTGSGGGGDASGMTSSGGMGGLGTGGATSSGGAGGCAPSTCASLGIECGAANDGCAGVLQCGDCPSFQTCGGGCNPVPGKCAPEECCPMTCAQLGVECGLASDGCGGVLQCGDCPSFEVCGGGCDPVPGKCGPQNVCCPQTCATLGIECGPAGDGCGGLLQCGDCAAGQTCGGGGVPGHCGSCTDACTTSADCGSAAPVCAHDAISGCKGCWGKCDGSMCQGPGNTCVSDSDCVASAKCVCAPNGCTVCMIGL